MLTLSIIKADTGGFVGHTAVHPDMVAEARSAIDRVRSDLIVDGQVATCGDDLSLIRTYTRGPDTPAIHAFAWDVFVATTEIARRLGLYGAGQAPGP